MLELGEGNGDTGEHWNHNISQQVFEFWATIEKIARDMGNRWRQLQISLWWMVDIVRASSVCQLAMVLHSPHCHCCCHGQQCVEANKKQRKQGNTQPWRKLEVTCYKLCHTSQCIVSKFRKALWSCQQPPVNHGICLLP